jgi:putative sporulation protein YyaC
MKNRENPWFLCIGTDRSTGDSLAPLVGMFLKERGYTQVVGDLHDPCHAMNIADRFRTEIPAGAFVVAIDACLGQVSSVGRVTVREGSLAPGAGVGKDLGNYGDQAIHGVVNVGGFMEHFVLQNTRLSLVYKMALEIVAKIEVMYPIKKSAHCVV